MEKKNSTNHHNSFLDEATRDSSLVEEESGWTSYFEDFFNNNNKNIERETHNCNFSLSFESSCSMVSDAASFPSKRSTCDDNNINNHHVFDVCSSINGAPQNLPKVLSSKKKRAKEISFHDDSLEDTASSPVNSPKVSDMKLTEVNDPKKTSDHFHSSLGKEGTSTDMELKFERNSSDLKKRGLCLVPLSMFVNCLD